jgi:hypothetical protein
VLVLVLVLVLATRGLGAGLRRPAGGRLCCSSLVAGTFCERVESRGGWMLAARDGEGEGWAGGVAVVEGDGSIASALMLSQSRLAARPGWMEVRGWASPYTAMRLLQRSDTVGISSVSQPLADIWVRPSRQRSLRPPEDSQDRNLSTFKKAESCGKPAVAIRRCTRLAFGPCEERRASMGKCLIQRPPFLSRTG